MRVNYCPNCQEPLPGLAKYCAKCGESLFATEQSPHYYYDENQLTVKLADRPANLKVPHFYKKVATDANMSSTRPLGLPSSATPVTPEQDVPVVGNGSTPAALQIDDQLESGDDYEIQRSATWNKTVTYRSRHLPPAPVNPKPSTPLLLQEVPLGEPKRVPMRLFSWISVLAVIGLLLGGVFGIVMTLGNGGNKAQPSQGKGMLSLQATPSTVALGGMLTLHGSNFYPSGRVGLTRDANIPIVDMGGHSIIHADKTGSFSDTVRVDPLSWEVGPQRIIRAEDAHSHKSATFTVNVTGQAPLRPPHFVISMSSIDLGNGDQTTNSTQMIWLSNGGGGLISWKATATESWLLVSPASGTISYGHPMQVTIAGDRSNLNVGSYTAGVIFNTLNAGQANLAVKMGVEPLQPGHEAVQLSPPVLTFTGTDGSVDPPGQIVTVSNPGKLPLQWSASSYTSDGSSWLTVDPQSGTVAKGNSWPVTVSVDIESLLPGFYSGSVTFTSQGPGAVQVSQQTIYVSLTIVPQCALQVSPGALTFTSVYLQQAPASQAVNMGVTQGCSNPLSWSAFATMNNGGNWLSISSTSGTTLTNPNPLVNVTTTGLTPGTYSGSVTFIWSGGTQTLPVTFVMGQATTPLLATTSQAIPFNGVTGQPNPPPQTATVTNSGGGTLNWYATTVGGAWLSVMPSNGTLVSQQSVRININVALSTLIPGTYNGMITISGTDSSNHPAAGSPQTIPVTFVVQAACAITVTPPALTFQGVVRQQPDPAAQSVTIAAGGACGGNALSWTATTATTPAGGKWLRATPASGTVDLKTSSATSVSIKLAGLTAGSYSGTVTITAVDSVTNQPVGAPQTITVNLTVQPPCTLQNPSQQVETFSTETGLNPAPQTFTVSVIGSCKGTVTVTPTVATGSGAGWLAVSPTSAPLTSGASATFTVTATSAALAQGSHTGSISLAAVDSDGITITGSPQAVAVTLNVLTSPQLTAGPGLSFNVPTGTSSQQITIANTGGAPLNWTAALDSKAPSFMSLSVGSGTNLLGGTSTTTSVNVNATGLTGGTSYTTKVTITAFDAITGNVVVGSPSTIAVTITIAPPQMTLKMTLTSGSLAFTTTARSNPAAQTITIQNTGGNTLTWTVGTPSASWLTVTPTSGSDNAQVSSTITFNVNAAGLKPGTHDATVVITPTPGAAVTVQVTLTVNKPTS